MLFKIVTKSTRNSWTAQPDLISDSILLSKKGYVGKILIDQGSKDNFFDNLSPKSLEKLVSATNEDNLFRYQEGYDHSYFFVSTFIQEHVFWHEKQLRGWVYSPQSLY